MIDRTGRAEGPNAFDRLMGTVGAMEHSLRVCEWLGWGATVLAVIGVVLNNYRLWPCFLFWMVSNATSAVIHKIQGPRSLLVRDLIFFALACVGLWQWTR